VFKDCDSAKEKENKPLIGTAEYISPEMIQEGNCGYEADLWALGCIVYQLFHNHLPFSGSNNHTIMSNVFQHKMNPIDKNLSGEVKDLIQQLLVPNPNKRLGANRSFKTLKAHPFFKGINFDALHTLDPPLDDTEERDRKTSFQHKNNIVYNKLNPDCEVEVEDSYIDLYIEEPEEISNSSENIVYYEDVIKKRSPWFHFNKRRLILFGNKMEYHDPLTNIKKGEIVLNRHCDATLKDHYTFEVFTPMRTFLFKTEGKTAWIWCEKINSVVENIKREEFN